MRADASNFIPLVGLLLLLTIGGGARAQSPGIRDEGKFFGADAIKSAEAAIQRIEMIHQKDPNAPLVFLPLPPGEGIMIAPIQTSLGDLP